MNEQLNEFSTGSETLCVFLCASAEVISIDFLISFVLEEIWNTIKFYNVY